MRQPNSLRNSVAVLLVGGLLFAGTGCSSAEAPVDTPAVVTSPDNRSMQQRGIDDATKILGKLGTESLKTYENAQNIWVTDDFSDGKSSALIREASVNTATGQITLGANITTAGGGTDLISIEIDGIATDTKDTDPAKRPALTGLDAVRAAFDPDTSRVTRLTTYNGQKPDGPYVYFLSYLGCSRDEHNPSYHCVLKDQSDNEDRSENSLNPTMQANLTALEQELQIG